MDAGTHGVLGAAAAKHVEVGCSSGSGSAKGLSSVGSPALEKRGSTSGAMKGDALVSDPEAVEKCSYATIKRFLTLILGPSCSEPHEICAEQNTGEAVWRKTPAGDEAAVVCPADASGTLPTAASSLFAVCFHHDIIQISAFSYNRHDSTALHPGCCRSRLLGKPNLCQVCL